MTTFARRLYATHPASVIEVFYRVTRLPVFTIRQVLDRSLQHVSDEQLFVQLQSHMKPNPTNANSNSSASSTSARGSRRADEVNRLLRFRQFQRYLDIGCGDMELTQCLAATLLQAGGRAFATDVLAQHAPKDASIEFKLTDGRALPFDSQSMDLVTCFHSLHHFVHLDQMLAEVRRVLKSNGMLVLREHDCNSEVTHDLISLMHVGWCVINHEQAVEPIHMSRTQAAWQELLVQQGFVPVGAPPSVAPTVDRLYLQAFEYKPPLARPCKPAEECGANIGGMECVDNKQ